VDGSLVLSADLQKGTKPNSEAKTLRRNEAVEDFRHHCMNIPCGLDRRRVSYRGTVMEAKEKKKPRCRNTIG
jgi:hypothetical protein